VVSSRAFYADEVKPLSEKKHQTLVFADVIIIEQSSVI
jgi:hypothetical protein